MNELNLQLGTIEKTLCLAFLFPVGDLSPGIVCLFFVFFGVNRVFVGLAVFSTVSSLETCGWNL